MTFYAHSKNDVGQMETVGKHLRDVAATAARFAAAFGCPDEAYVTGLLHDLGKYSALFQRRLEGIERAVDHWSVGAWAALNEYRSSGIAAAVAINGHHLGLQQASKDALAELAPGKAASATLRRPEEPVDKLLDLCAGDGLQLPDSLPETIYSGLQGSAAAMLDVRMLFSALVDADYLETEAHFAATVPGQKRYREPGPPLEAGRMLAALLGHVEQVAQRSEATLGVKQMRADLLAACLRAAEQPPGLFTLTAPTGTGKTFSMLAFALKHAQIHGMRRIVTVIPYLTIIEQTVQAYRSALAAAYSAEDLSDLVLEDHSLAGTDQATGRHDEHDDEQEDHARLLAENWDAPIIVTTSVQFLESLFANGPRRCRKLHRLARSVILFDEVQTLRPSLAVPTLATLSHLSQRYGATIVFSTATQPAFSHLDDPVRRHCSAGWRPTEIVPDSLRLFERARRTTVVTKRLVDRMTWEELADELSTERQALCIVNLKRHALELYDLLASRGQCSPLHLSTSMCPAHRQDVLADVRERLAGDLPCTLVSTQCVEAGVDLDFPMVYRAWGPLDALAQAAGRCNRHGLRQTGEVRLFKPADEDNPYPDRAYQQAAMVAENMLQRSGAESLDLNDPALFEQYYRELYDMRGVGKTEGELLQSICIQHFAEVARQYRVIEQNSVNVLVPYLPEEFQSLVAEVRETGLNRSWIRRARPYTIGMFRPRPRDRVMDRMEPVPVRRGKRGVSENAEDWFIYLWEEDYRPDVGLVTPTTLPLVIG